MRVGFDIGGTFTDVIAFRRDGGIRTAKILSLLDRVGDDLARMIRDDAVADPVEVFVHGTTQASNAVIENLTARTGLIATRGFRDDLEIRNLRRPNVFDLNWDRPPAFIPRRLRTEIDERILADGSIDRPLDLVQARGTIEKLLAEDVEAIAVCLINSYVNPRHEQAVRDLIAGLSTKVVVCLSSEIRPEIREYERASTTAINAALVPVIDRYLGRLEKTLQPLSKRLLVMQSNGGLMTAAAARRRPYLMIESGPAAGVLAAARLAEEAGLTRVLSVDMGGTTAKACLIENYIPFEKPQGEIGGGANIASRGYSGAGHALRAPGIDLVEVGAGGGSIAWLDEGGLLRLGPRSAGADPGPACYGRGGIEPTVTDANIALGYMNPRAIAGATLGVDRDAAVAAIKTRLADRLGRSVEDVAYAITQLTSAVMMRAVRAVSTERGRDPREFVMLAFGGAGPMHAASLAASMGITHIVTPLVPGLFSALGLLLADYRQDYVRSLAIPVDRVTAAQLRDAFAALRSQALAEFSAQGVPADGVSHDLQVDLRYRHQLSELVAPFEIAAGDDESTRVGLNAAFHAAHQRAFGYVLAGEPVELVSLRLRARAQAGAVRFADLVRRIESAPRAGSESSRRAYFGPQGWLDTRIASRAEIDGEMRGPMIIEEADTTIVVPPGWSATRDGLGNLHLRVAR